MIADTSVGRRPTIVSTAACVAFAVLAFTACDTGDGTTLRDPTAPTTLPPPPTEPLESVPLDSVPLESVPISDIPTTVAGASTAPPPTPPAETPSSFELFAPWADGGVIDPRFTCDGADVSPPLSWVATPRDAVEIAIAMVDESDTSRGRPFVHWVIGGIDADDETLAEGAVPIGAIQGLNFFGEVGYSGPCPPPDDEPHEFDVTIYALNQQLEAADGTPAAELIDLVETLAIDSSSRAGLAQR